MKVGILGSGDVGLKLGDSFLAVDNTVKIGTRNTSKENIISWIARNGQKATAGSFEDTASFGDIIVLATLWSGTSDAIKLANPKNFAGKVTIDVTNPLDFSKGIPRLALGHTSSGGETIQKLLPDAKVVKAFNTIGNLHFFHPDFLGGPPTMFICGNDLDAKKQVTNILSEFGWETVDTGGIEESRLLEPLAMLWINHYFKTNSGNHAFKLLRK
jgi:8-hydroxy-5-deazaflavin:NADPH oxidoreductase